MGKQTPTTLSATIAGQTISLEHGKLAALADGSVVLRYGNTMILATVVSDHKAKEGQSFFPLSVEYREKFASAGRIPGNFFKRETRPSDYEVLVSRLIDRAIRPLFPETYLNETQVFVTLISAEYETLPDAWAAFAASAALMVSDIPFLGPISEVRVARINGAFVVNPSRTELKNADMDFIVAGSLDSIVMVEGEAKEAQEADLVEAIRIAHEAIKAQCNLQLELRKTVGITENRPVLVAPADAEIEAEVKAFAADKFLAVARAGSSKAVRKAAFSEVEKATVAHLTETKGAEYASENASLISFYISELNRNTVREMAMAERRRLDGRNPEEIRNIWSEVDYLPAAHGSAVFTRGETQSLTSVTLGSKLDEALIDNALEEYHERFLLHYNFPPFSTGEVKPVRGISRREVGHGNLARRSLYQMMPQDYPYTVRIVSDILESNGSSSMATVCAGSLALMDAGVPIRKAVAGIAMGLITDNKGRDVVLSDILGDEDHLGDMDFKVTGTSEGICGCQMDIKIEGLDYDLLVRALNQAKAGRLHILNEMSKTIAVANPELKPHAPRIVGLEIPADTIGAVIGQGGKVIQGIQARTGTTITIEEKDGKGHVLISGVGMDKVNAALKIVKGIVTDPEEGEEFEATVVTIMAFGAFVEFLPSKEGLVHVSELAWHRVENPADVVKTGDVVRVKYLGKDEKNGKYKLSIKALLPKPEGYVAPAPRVRTDNDRPKDGNFKKPYNNDRPRRD
jgi:polyribonucleotide nucleotidyltransferase